MADLVRLATSSESLEANVVFVHGLGAHPVWTWGKKASESEIWPNWIAEKFPNVDVWALSYNTPKTNWTGSSLELEDRVKTVMARLKTTHNTLDKPIVFVCHSLGGILVKALMRKAAQNQISDTSYDKLLKSTQGIVFIATPHTGSSIATWANRFRFLIWPSLATIGLSKNNSYLRELNSWFQNWKAKPRVLVFYGTEDKVVEISSSNPNLTNVEPIPIEGDHSSICVPKSKDDILPIATIDFIKNALNLQESSEERLRPMLNQKIRRQKPPAFPFIFRLSLLLAMCATIATVLFNSFETPSPSNLETNNEPSKSLKLDLEVSKSLLKVGQKWHMTILSNKTCELQILYEQSDGELIDVTRDYPEVVGGTVLKSNIKKRIPILEFEDSFIASYPLGTETLIAHCKQGGIQPIQVDIDKINSELKAKQSISKGLYIDLSNHTLNGGEQYSVVMKSMRIVE